MIDWSPGEVLRIADLARQQARLLQRLAEIDEMLKRDLPTLLTGIAAVSETPLKLIDFIIQVRRAGYTTKAKACISGMTYHGVKILVRQGVLKWDEASQGYVLAGKGPAPSEK